MLFVFWIGVPILDPPSSIAVVEEFRDLDTYQKARRQSRHIFKLTRGFPKEETYALTDQIRRSSRAVGALIAEAWARRRYEAAFVNKINQALGEAMETQSWLDAAHDCEYITAETHGALDTEWQHIGGKLNRMIQCADRFCQ
jgi:four helix bundle protein